MKYAEQIQTEERKPPAWHYFGLTGIAAWFSEEHEEVIKDRIRRTMNANAIEGNTMRYCHYCEVGVGVMTYETYELLYISLVNKCPTCGNTAFNPDGIWERNE